MTQDADPAAGPASPAPLNASTAQARALLDELARGGVADVVVCPGSRSAALAFAAHDLATRGVVRLHTRLDERTAAFLALGLARTSRRPVVVLTTSGTATANLHPAVLEASHAGLPLVVVTADRPARLRGTGANQTTDQVHLYGAAPRLFADVPAGAAGAGEPQQVAGWRSLVSRAVLTATGAAGRPPGPVHLNVQLDGPATPDVADGWTAPVDGRPDGAAWTTGPSTTRPLVPRPGPDGLDHRDGGDPLAEDVPTVVVAGDDAGPPARVLAEERGWPLLAEPSSGSRTGANAIRTYRLLLGDDALTSRVRRVVVAGHPTLSRPVTRLLSRADVEVVALADARGGWTDPGHRVARVLDRAPLLATRADRPAPGPWLQEWLDRDAAVGARLDALLDEHAAAGDLTPHHVAGEVATALPPGGLLLVGASNPVRDLDLMVPRYDVGARRMVVANRGLAGIDGTVSSAVGAALGRPRSTRALALVGDVTFLHDATGLVLGPDEPRPDLTVVVVNDDGGSIFALLEQGSPAHAGSFERLFATPHGVDLGALCAATGTPHTRVRDRDGLRAALVREPQGIEVVEAVVRRDTRRELDAAIRALATS